MEIYNKLSCETRQAYNKDYELQIVYSRSCKLNSKGEEVGKSEYSIEMYDIDMNLSTIGVFESFEEMREFLNEENLFECLDNDSIIGIYENEDPDSDDIQIAVEFNRVLFNGELIIRQNQ